VIPDYTKHNCYFTNTPDAVTQSTADFTVFLFLAALRGSTYCEMVANKGLWHQGLELTTDPDGLTLGVIGMGRIGKDFARKVRAFGVKIIYNTRTRLPEEEEKTLGLTYVSKAELVKTSDVISCLTPFTAETYHLLDHDEFKAMKSESRF
jgi:lactate dehydrogenase-like 2-hydroxyacid dehydrogenase